MNFSYSSILYIEFLFEFRFEGVVVSNGSISLADIEVIVVGGEGGADELVSVAVSCPTAWEV